MSRCNYCMLQDIRKFAANTEGEVTLHSKFLGTVDYPDVAFPDGVDVFVNEVWIAWFAELPEVCTC